MPLKVQRVEQGSFPSPAVKAKGFVRPMGLQLTLPTQKNNPIVSLNRSSWLIYGKKLIGKTELAARFGRALVISFEPGASELEIYNVDIPIGSKTFPGWNHFVKYVDLLEKDKLNAIPKFETAVIDTGFEGYNRALEYVCWKEGWSYPSEGKDRGVGWKKVGDEFRHQLIRLEQLGMGIVIVCHDKMIEQETRSGQKFDMVVPKLSAQADDFFRATIQNIGYYHYRGGERYLTIRGSDYIVAGVRSSNHFRTVSGEPIYSIPMGNSPDEAYENFVRAFNNDQEISFFDETKRFADEEIARSIRRKVELKMKKAASR
jgi:hypothetical protein